MSKNRENKSKTNFILHLTLHIVIGLIMLSFFYYASLGYSELMLIYESSSNIQLFLSLIYIVTAIYSIKLFNLLTDINDRLWKKN